MKEKLLNWIRNRTSTLRNLVPFQITPNTSATDNDAEQQRKFTDALDSFSGFFGKLAKNFEENNHLQQFITIGESFRKRGYYAGQWGVREEDIKGSAAVQVRIEKNLIDEKSRSNQRRLNSQVKILKTIKKNAERDYKTKNSYYEKLNRAYQYNHKQFSLPLGIIYGVIAVLLVVADIPLALDLTRRGFDLKTDLNNPIGDLFSLTADEGFIFHFFKVLMGNWEVVLLATGIALCTIYVKIFYDDYLGIPLENLIKKASESPRAEYEEIKQAENGEDEALEESATAMEAPIDKKKISDNFSRLWWVRFSVKLGVLLTLLLTIVVLGGFRYYVVTSETVTAPGWITFFTYLFLTLIFPIISGICASLSLSNLHNWAERRDAEKESSQARQEVLKATDEFREKKEEKERNSGFIEWLDSKETIPLLTEYLIRCYESGYKFGYLYPEWTFGGDLFTRAEAMRNRNLIDPTIPSGGLNPAQVTSQALN
jgi:hypothetical protein